MSETVPLDEPPNPSETALRRHAFYRGKIQTMPKVPILGAGDWPIWYTPGVAAPCLDIVKTPERVYDLTNKGNSIAVVSDGSRILGLGDIGPEAGLPVMEGKALLFKYLGGVDAVPLCLRTGDENAFVDAVRALEPSFGGINLEDIAQPKCFRVLERLRAEMKIPVWHDDQQGSATVVLAGLINALKFVGKEIGRVRFAFIGTGAANIATYRLLKKAGMEPGSVMACDSKGCLHRGRADIQRAAAVFPDKWRLCNETNPEQIAGGIEAALKNADVCLAFSKPGPDVIDMRAIAGMAPDAIVFACANPVPEIWPRLAYAAGARVVATGRSDFANQVNNSLVFPGIFRGVLDIRATTISDEMAMAAAAELAACVGEAELREDYLLPRMGDERVAPRLAVATAMAALRQGAARLALDEAEIRRLAVAKIGEARVATEALVRAGVIPPPN